MTLLDEFTERVEREADNRFAEFLEEFLAYERSPANVCAHEASEAEIKQAFREYMRAHKVYKLKTLRRMAIEVKGDVPAFCEWVNWYENWRRRAGFQDAGGGGPRYLMTMTDDERHAFLAEMEEKHRQLPALLLAVQRPLFTKDWRSWI